MNSKKRNRRDPRAEHLDEYLALIQKYQREPGSGSDMTATLQPKRHPVVTVDRILFL